MKIEDVKIGSKVKLISTENTDEHLGYDLDEMLHVGSVSEVVDFGEEGDECHNVELSDGYWYAIEDLELYEDTGKVLSEIKVTLQPILISSIFISLSYLYKSFSKRTSSFRCLFISSATCFVYRLDMKRYT